MKRGVLINEKPNQGVREGKKVGIHWCRGNPLESERGFDVLLVFSSLKAAVAAVFRVVKGKKESGKGRSHKAHDWVNTDCHE
jgi:hypothetical protein